VVCLSGSFKTNIMKKLKFLLCLLFKMELVNHMTSTCPLSVNLCESCGVDGEVRLLSGESDLFFLYLYFSLALHLHFILISFNLFLTLNNRNGGHYNFHFNSETAQGQPVCGVELR
jgi:hypothetical protein